MRVRPMQASVTVPQTVEQLPSSSSFVTRLILLFKAVHSLAFAGSWSKSRMFPRESRDKRNEAALQDVLLNPWTMITERFAGVIREISRNVRPKILDYHPNSNEEVWAVVCW